MPETSGIPATAVTHAPAMTPATRNSKDDINSMTATMLATAGMKARTGPQTQ